MMNTNIRKFFVFISVFALSLGVVTSCKDDDDETEYYYLSGTLALNVPDYMAPSTTMTVTPLGVTHPGGGRVGYYFTPSWTAVADTTKSAYASDLPDSSYTFTVPAVEGTYTLKANAYTADEYYGTTTTAYVSVVDSSLNGSLSNTGIRPTNSSFTDSRDGKTYYYLTDDNGLMWMRQNLAYEGAGVSYKQCSVMSSVFGQYYTWDEAQNVCPDGWHLPTESDWLALGKQILGTAPETGSTWQEVAGDLMVDATFLGETMWSYAKGVTITNKYLFGAIPVGYAVQEEGSASFSGVQEYATFWSSGDYNDFGIYRYINTNSNNVVTGYADKDTFMASVRCVK
ncbi:MAG: hypothetical protein K5984_03350 [Bacteroidales bacterium]|nr:hypothetical protein [Bacteroidales bacterium]